MGRSASEQELLDAVVAAVGGPPPPAGIGDDAAVVAWDGPLLACHDLMVAGTHFDLGWARPRDVGHKVLAVNLSDIAAMGGRPRVALVGLTVPPALPPGAIGELYEGLAALAATHDVAVVGGDTTGGPVLSVGLTLLGAPHPTGTLTRSAARSGDLLCVTGALGAAAAGLALLSGMVPSEARPPQAATLERAQLRPEPRLAAGDALVAAGVRAAMDVSDGLLLDAGRLARAAGLAAVIDIDRVPRAAGVEAVAAALDRPPDLFAATGGEDYELLVALSPALLATARAAGLTLFPVGELTEGSGLKVHRSGTPVAVAHAGWQAP